MSVSAELISGDAAPPPDTSAIPAFVFPSELGAGDVFQFSPGADVYASLGSSAGAEDVYWFMRTAKQSCVVGICAGIAGSKSAVTHVGSGPAVTAALTGSYTGPLLSTSFGAKVTVGGANGIGQIGYYLDGSGDYSQYSAVIPSEAPAVLTGVGDISFGAVLTRYIATVLTPEHLDYTAPAAKVLAFPAGSLAASAAGLRAAFATSIAVQTWTSADLLDAGETVILAHARKLIFTTAGTAADAPASVTITGTLRGAVVTEVLSISQVAGAVSSVKVYDAITSLVFAAGDGATATVALGYSDAYATAQEIADAFNVAAIAAPLAVRARVSETADGTFLETYSTSLGSGVTQTVAAEGTSTAGSALGFTTADGNLTAVGAAATMPIVYVGITLTFASGTYVADETYTLTTTGPGADVASISAAETLIRASGFPFGYLLPLVVPATAGNARSLCDAQDALVSTWDTDANQAIFPIQLTPGPFHVASATPATNAANMTTNDTALVAAFAGQTSIATVVPDDGYRTGTKIVGRYRRPAALGLSYMLSRFLLSDDPGAATHGIIPEWSLTASDGVTLARDQANPTTVIQLGGSNGPGFTVLQNVNGKPRVKRGVTRAGSTSRLVDLGPGLRMGRRGQGVLYNTAKTQVENENYPTDANGRIVEGVRNALVGTFYDPLAAALLTPPLNLNASSVTVTIDAAEVIADTKNITVTAILQKLGSAENVAITAIVAGVVQSTTIQG